MNKLLVATLFLVIGGSLGSKEELEGINTQRKNHAKKIGATLEPLTYSPKLEEMAKKYCEKCPPKNQVKEPGYRVYPIENTDDRQNVDNGVMMYPETREFGMCRNEKCKNFHTLYIVNSDKLITYSLTFLMAFVLIFSGI